MRVAYRVIQPPTVSDSMLRRMMHRKIVPLSELFPEVNFTNLDVDTIMSSDEAMQLSMPEVDSVEEQLTEIKRLIPGNWLVIYSNEFRPMHFMKFERYKFVPHQAHLYIKHYASISAAKTVDPATLHPELTDAISARTHLDKLPSAIDSIISDIEEELAAVQAKKRKKQRLNSKKKTKRLRRPTKNGPVKLVRGRSESFVQGKKSNITVGPGMNRLTKKAEKRRRAMLEANKLFEQAIPNRSSYNDTQSKD